MDINGRKSQRESSSGCAGMYRLVYHDDVTRLYGGICVSSGGRLPRVSFGGIIVVVFPEPVSMADYH